MSPNGVSRREEILRAAVRLADRGGIESLSMRGLARAVRMKTMSVYVYVANKDELLSGMLDAVVAEFEPPDAAGDWREALRRSLTSAHGALMRHPWAAPLMTARTGSLARLRYMEALLGRLRGAGFSAEMTHHAYHALDSHLVGSALWEQGYRSQRDLASNVERFLRERGQEYPYIVEHAQQHRGSTGAAGGSDFAFGLELILTGLDPSGRGHRVRASRASRSSPRRSTTGRESRAAPP